MRFDHETGMGKGKIGDTLFDCPVIPKLVVERLDEAAVLPTYATEGDSGMDLYAIEDVLIYPQDTELVRTGLKFQIPRHPLHELGYRWEMQVRPRSGVSLNTKLVVANAPGTVDNFYTDEVKVIMRNTSEVATYLDFSKDIDYVKVMDTNGDSYERVVEDITVEADMTRIMVPHVLDLKGKIVSWEQVPKHLWEDRYPVGTYLIRKGDRVAQIVFNQVIRPLEIVEGTVDDSNSRGGGFGSTGV